MTNPQSKDADYRFDLNGNVINQPEMVHDDGEVQDVLQSTIGNIPLLNSILHPTEVSLALKLQVDFKGVGGEAIGNNNIEIVSTVYELLFFLGELDSTQKTQLADLFNESLRDLAIELSSESMAKFYMNLLPDRLDKYYFFQFAKLIEDDGVDEIDKIKYLNRVILANIPQNLILLYLRNKEKNTIVHEYCHLCMRKIFSEDLSLRQYFPNNIEKNLIYQDDIWEERQQHNAKYRLTPADTEVKLEVIKTNLELHKKDKISDWIVKLPSDVAFRFITQLQFRAFEENFVRAFAFTQTGVNDSYQSDYTAYLSGGYFYSDVVPGITKIKNALNNIHSRHELKQYIHQMLVTFQQKAKRIVLDYNTNS